MTDIIDRISAGQEQFGLVVPLPRPPTEGLRDAIGQLALHPNLAKLSMFCPNADYAEGLEAAVRTARTSDRRELDEVPIRIMVARLPRDPTPGRQLAIQRFALDVAADAGDVCPTIIVGARAIVGGVARASGWTSVPHLGTKDRWPVVFEDFQLSAAIVPNGASVTNP